MQQGSQNSMAALPNDEASPGDEDALESEPQVMDEDESQDLYVDSIDDSHGCDDEDAVDSDMVDGMPERRGRAPGSRTLHGGDDRTRKTKCRRLSNGMTVSTTYGGGKCNFVVALPRLSQEEQAGFWPGDDADLKPSGQYPRRTRKHVSAISSPVFSQACFLVALSVTIPALHRMLKLAG